MKTKIINLIGGPGSGKSVACAELFASLKKQGFTCEMGLEFAKDKVWEESFKTLDDQIYIFGKQFHRLWRLVGKVDYVITDSPLLVSIYYNKEDSRYFNDFVIEQFNRFDNQVFFIQRGDRFEKEGRIQNLEQSKQIDEEMKEIMERYNIPYEEFPQSVAVENILGKITPPPYK